MTALSNIEPTPGYVLVDTSKAEVGGLINPTAQTGNHGKLIASGTTIARGDSTIYCPASEGDIIVFSEHLLIEGVVPDSSLCFVAFQDILAIIRE